MGLHKISKERLAEFKKLCEEKGIKYNVESLHLLPKNWSQIDRTEERLEAKFVSIVHVVYSFAIKSKTSWDFESLSVATYQLFLYDATIINCELAYWLMRQWNISLNLIL